ncbi:MAG: DUF2877 domain-containing protein, partial [Oscillospiraceae bacterium]|nr:DUF2877 domain-containing protein [Oscillospiraceae bacterium]
MEAKICLLLKQRLCCVSSEQMQRHSTFEHATNYICGESLFSILSGQPRVLPYSVSIPAQQCRPAFALNARGEWCVIGDKLYPVDKMSVYDPRPKLPKDPAKAEQLAARIVMLKEIILQSGKLHGAAPLVFPETLKQEQSHRFIREDFMHWRNAAQHGLGLIPESMKEICGFGTGLTPFLDDVLCGYMCASAYASIYWQGQVKPIEDIGQLRGCTNA